MDFIYFIYMFLNLNEKETVEFMGFNSWKIYEKEVGLSHQTLNGMTFIVMRG